MKRILLLCCVSFLLAVLAGCASSGGKFKESGPFADESTSSVTVTNQVSPELLRPSKAPFRLGPGDRVEIEILGLPESRTATAVGPDGKIYFYLLPGLEVWGLTLAETHDLLQKQLERYLEKPQVTVTLREVGSKQVWLLGRLNRPGIYPMPAPMTLLEAIALAGGSFTAGNQVSLQDVSDLRHSFVMRQGQPVPVDFYRLLREGDLSQNIYLEPDDFVYVPSALSQQVYVLGAVRLPRSMPYTDGMTLVSAIAGASGATTVDWFVPGNYGVTPDAYLSHVAIVRGSLSQPRLTVADFGAIIKGKARDVALEPGDIIYVPNTPYSTLKRYLNTILGTFITTLAANEGSAAGGGNSVGVSYGVGN